jgi:GxxExxY protein
MDETEADRDSQTHAVIGAAMAVHRELGSGFLEAVYQEALSLELAWRAVPFESQVPLAIFYRGQRLSLSYRADFICFGTLLVEIKALAGLAGQDKAQVLNYLKASGLEKALLFNFGSESLEFRRLMRD